MLSIVTQMTIHEPPQPPCCEQVFSWMSPLSPVFWIIFGIFVLIALWELTWKGLALYKAGNNKDKYWFIAILFLNTVGILPILYYFYFSKKGNLRLNKKGEQ